MKIDLSQIPSPAYVLDETLLEKNLQLMAKVQKDAGVSIIVAFKGFSMWSAFPMLRKYLSGATASSLNEALLCSEEMKCKAHTYSPAYLPSEIDQILDCSSHITFNSLGELERFRDKAVAKSVSIGLRLNPECSVVETDLYNPCSPTSRLGILHEELTQLPEDVEGLHVHALCESGSEELQQVIAAIESKFGHLLPQVKWVNFGGGHLMTRKGYDLELLVSILKKFKKDHNVEIILEPGSAVAWETGVLIATVLDIVERRGISSAIMDISFTAHMPDTLEMPYRPRITGAGHAGEHLHTYRIGGSSCLAGDFKDDYSFPQRLQPGQKLIFEDMIHYTMVKTNMFNGVTHPEIGILGTDGKYRTCRKFEYSDYKTRLS